MIVCEHCLRAIDSREGNNFVRRYEMDFGEEEKCEWCKEMCDELYEILDGDDE